MAKVGQVNRGNDASTGELGSLTGKVMGFFLGIFFSALGGKSCFCFFFFCFVPLRWLDQSKMVMCC